MARTTALFLLLALAAPLAFAAPIHDAAKKGDAAEVRRLLDEGADVNARDDDGSTPLSLTLRDANGYDIALIKLLLERGADINIQDKRGNTALFWCVGKYGDGQREVFDLLMQKGATMDNRKNSAGYSLADFAVSGGNVGILKELISKGAKLDIQKSVSRAALLGSKEMLEHILNAGGDPNADRRSDTPPLIDCFLARNGTEKARLLLDRGANVNARNKEGRTALLTAIDKIDGVQLLFERGADVNLADSRGWTPLMQAVMSDTPNSARIVKLLLDKGADIDLKIPMGGEMTISSVGGNSKNPEVRELIKAARADLKYCLKKDDFDAAATDALIASKNEFLPGFLSTTSNEQKVKMLTAVEKQIAKAKVRMGEFNEQGRAALRKGKDASASRKEALQIGAYLDVLKEIKAILEGS